MKSLVLCLLLAGCNDMTMQGMDGGTDDAGGDLGFQTAPHLPFPQLTLHTTPVLANAQMVTVTYQDFTFKNQVEQWGDFVINSQWMETVGKEYGVGKPTHIKAPLAMNAPASITDANIIAFIKQQAMMGNLPAPSATNNQLVYMMYFPSTTKIDDGTGAILCVQGYSGYHYSDVLNGTDFYYAVLPACGNVLDDLTSTAAHELIEAATDPSDGYYLDVDPTDHWSGLINQEVADLCQDLPNVTEGGFALQRSWSNAAAAAGGSPCVPVPQGEIFTNMTPDPPSVMTIPAGSTTTVTVTGWSTAPVDDWTLSYYPTDVSDFQPTVLVGAAQINNGKSTTVMLGVPAGTPSGQMGAVQVYMGETSGNFWPLTVRVK
jgi:hypothetical protein